MPTATNVETSINTIAMAPPSKANEPVAARAGLKIASISKRTAVKQSLFISNRTVKPLAGNYYDLLCTGCNRFTGLCKVQGTAA